MQEAQRAKVLTFPTSSPPQPTRRPLECRITTAPERISPDELTEACRRLARSFEKRWGFSLPVLVFDTDADQQADEWILTMRGNEVFRGRLEADGFMTIARELSEKPWRIFSYENFRSRLQELEEWEPFLFQEVSNRLNLVLTWQVFQGLLKSGGSLHRFSSKLERLLVESESRPGDQLLSPRILSSLQQC